MIILEEVQHSYGDQPVLRDINLTLTEQRIGVIGANGSGKSTLARMLNGLILPQKGRVLVNKMDTRKDGHAIRRQVGFTFPDADNQIIMPTVAEDVALGLSQQGLTKSEIRERTEKILAEYNLSKYHDHPAHLLSGGEKQLLALAAVLVTEPQILVCDEPTTLLDLRNRNIVSNTLASLSQQLILLTHHLDLVAEFDRVLVINEGQVAFDGQPEQAISHYLALMAHE